ncbi:MAG TPA: hypothetical protein VM327_02070 [Candidatus Thermoplasmatota archaeon]|nr:hypothetical protein [Candidatus Thermoplasmatota archaeon]
MRIVAAVLPALLVATLAGCLDGPDAPSDGDASRPALPHLGFLPPVDLLCPSEGAGQVLNAAFGDCGKFGEPVLEVAGDGAVWASATCCVGRSPPIWVSRDGGASFGLLPFADRTGVVRDAFGIEGDFGIDDAGNAYFFDISAASSWFSKYRADGTHVFTKADVFPPLVDRPWVRGGVEDEAWVFYNTGSATNLFHSVDGGLTWTVTPFGFECGLMAIGQGVSRDDLFVAGCTDAPALWVSHDGGATFGPRIDLPVPDLGVRPEDLPNGTGAYPEMPPVADEAGNVYVPFTWTLDRDGHRQGIYVDVVHPDGRIVGPLLVSGGLAWNEMPWGAAASEGRFAVAWYAANVSRPEAKDAVWQLKVAATVDGGSDVPLFQVADADPEPVLQGQALGRNLGDFLQSDIGPDGRLYTIYARRGDDGRLVNRVVVSDGALAFGAGIPRNGPSPG